MDTIYNKITVNGKTLIDISSDTVDAEHLMQGYTAHDSSGVQIIGTATNSGGVPNIYQDENGVLILDSESTEVGEWKRPLNWMPYADGWDDDDFDGCYFVYDLIDNTSDLEYPQWWALYGRTDTGQFTVDCGYVDESGVFTVDETYSVNGGNRTGGFLPIWDGITLNERYYVVRITPTTGHLLNVSFSYLNNSQYAEKYSGASLNSPGSNIQYQPCVELYGRLPYYTNADYEGRFQNYNLKHVYLLDMTSLTKLTCMFRYCYMLEKIDGMETWDTSAVVNMEYMFADCFSLTSLEGIENFDVINVQNLTYTFSNLGKIKDLNLGNWILSQTPIISYLFRGSAFKKVILPSGLIGTENQSDMFRDCHCLKDIDFNGSIIRLASYTFNGCNSLNIDTTSPSIITSTSNMNSEFLNNYMLKRIDLRGKDTSAVTIMANFANNCCSLQSADFTGCDFSAVTNTNTDMFSNCYSLVELKGFVYYQSFKLPQSTLMPAENLVEVLTNLPTVGSAKTITLGTTNKNKLTAEQIAIATEKGWTVA